MKYLRSYLLVPGAGSQILGSRSSGHRPLRRLTTGHHHSKVTRSCSFKYFLGQKRQVSTDGAKKSQLAVVSQVAPALPPPSDSKIEVRRYVPVQRSRQEEKSYGLPEQRNSRPCNPNFSVCPKVLLEPMSYGQFLGDPNSLKSSLDPLPVEMAFMPTFHLFRNDIEALFFSSRPKSAGAPTSSTLDATPVCNNVSETADPEILGVERSKSLEALLPTTENNLLIEDVFPDVSTRTVKREIVLPRTSKPAFLTLPQHNCDTFLEVHNFQKRVIDGSEEEKGENIGSFPKSEETVNSPGSFIIQNDRSSVIIHRDLYITNRILEKLKKMEENPDITPEPTVKVDDLSVAGHYDQCVGNVSPEGMIHPSANQKANPKACSRAISCISLAGLRDFSAGYNSDRILALPSAKLSSTSRNIHPSTSDCYLTNLEFKVPSDRMSASACMALQSRKNIYARMKNVSSPCVLIDGIHVKHAKLEDAIPGLVNRNSSVTDDGPANSGTTSDANHFSVGHAETNPIADDFNNSSAAEGSSNYNLSEIKHAPKGISAIHDDSVPVERSLLFPESHNVQHHSDYRLEGISEPDLSETIDLISNQPTVGCLDSGNLQGELEDWFIPLGFEIDSMLLTLEASNIPIEYPGRIPGDVEEDRSIFEEISNDKEHNISVEMEQRDSYPLEGTEVIENALLSPHEPLPFDSGRYRDKSTSSGSLPPKSKNPHVDIKTETTIKCCRSGDNTDINVTETQSYLDKRLPYPFCTETVLQVYGTSDSLSKAAQAVENSKAQLVHLSNANSPNPGMLTPKLQFNHMLSKSHENVKPNSKKTVLKIKVVPNAETSSPTAQSSESKPQPSHILQLSEHPAETSTDVSKLIRRSKFSQKPGPKKGRRGDPAVKLRPKKKFTKESSENIKVLSPKDLEKMFPSPPKPKPVEKPRKVTIETKMGKESSDMVENVKRHSSVSGFMAAQFKSRKVHDDILIKPIASSSADTKVINLPAAEAVPQSTKPNPVPKEESDAALSARDQKILKSIISHKVKDSFMAVTKKVPNPEAVSEVAKPDLVKKGHADVSSRISKPASGPRAVRVADQTSSIESRAKPSIDIKKLKSPLSHTGDGLSSYVDYNVSNSYQNDPKTVYASIMGTTREKENKEKVPPQRQKPESPTPKQNREYVMLKTKPSSKETTTGTGKAAPLKVSHLGSKKVETKLDESVLPASASVMIANAMKSSSELSQSESRWHHLDRKTASNENLKEIFPQEKIPIRSKPDNQGKIISQESTSQREFQENKVETNVKNEGEKSIPNRPKTRNEIENIKMVNMADALKDKKVWNHPSEPLFFPFETPNYKEVLQEPPRKSLYTQSIPHEGSIPKSSPDPAAYETDFCKLSTESAPRLVQSAPARYRVPLDRMKAFPLVNPGKAKTYSVPSSGVMSINPQHDIMLMRNLTLVPAVTKILGATLSAKSQQALDRWKQGLISTLGEQGFQEFYENQLKRGTDFHSTVKRFLVNRLDSKGDLCMRSLSSVLGFVSDVSVVESQVIHPLLGYRGVVDCVAKYKGKPVVIEWKRSDKAKPSLKHTYDAPLQLSAYFGAINFDSNYKTQQVEGGVVVVAYSDGSPADVFELSVEECERYWSKWLKRLHQYYSKSAATSE